jgi:ABC-type nitrate/sulfonate/bicarbonate transport system substrate-binding protein
MTTTPTEEKMTAKMRIAAAAGLLAMGLALPAQAQDQVRTTSITAYTGFYIYVADRLGLFAEHGIETEPRWFPSGAPIMQEAAAAQWDISFLGAPPTVLGGPALGLMTVGMIAEEGSMHELIGRPDFVAAARENPETLRGAQIFVTTMSTGHYMTESCLQSMGLTMDDVRVLPSEQQATLSAFVTGQGDLAQVWSPQTTALKARGNEVLCGAAELELSMPGVTVAHPAFIARTDPDVIVRWLRATDAAVQWIREDRARTFEMYREYDAFRGFNFADEFLETEVDLVMSTYMDLGQQIEMLSASADGRPPIVTSFEGIAEFFIRQGRLQDLPDYLPVIDPQYLVAAAAD